MMDYGEVLSRAWRIIWKFKILWIFGILAGCGQASTSGGGNAGSRINYGVGRQELPRALQNVPTGVWITIVLVILLILLILWLIFIFLGTIGRIGLFRGTQQADKGEERLIFGELFSGSMPYFWRVFGLSFLVGLVSLIAFLILGLPLIVCTLGIGFVCIIPISWLIQLVIEQANNAIVLENLGLLDGLRRGWDVVTKNLGSMIVMALILYLGISLIAGFIIGLPLLAAFGPVIAALFASAASGTNINEIAPRTLIFAGICFVAYLPVLIILSGLLRSYVSSAWTLTYMRLSGKTGAPSASVLVETLPPPS